MLTDKKIILENIFSIKSISPFSENLISHGVFLNKKDAEKLFLNLSDKGIKNLIVSVENTVLFKEV